MKTVWMSPRVGVGFERIGNEADAERLSGVVALGLALGGSDTESLTMVEVVKFRRWLKISLFRKGM